MNTRSIRPGGRARLIAGLALLLVLAVHLPAVAVQYRTRPKSPDPTGRRLLLDDFTVWASPEWEKQPWTKGDRSKGWRLRYRPADEENAPSPLVLHFSTASKASSTMDEVRAEQERLKAEVKSSYPDGFLAREMDLAGEKTLVLRYFNRGGTVFLVLPRQDRTIYEIYVWVAAQVRELPPKVQEVLSTLTLPGQPPFRPAAP